MLAQVSYPKTLWLPHPWKCLWLGGWGFEQPGLWCSAVLLPCTLSSVIILQP